MINSCEIIYNPAIMEIKKTNYLRVIEELL